MDVTAHSLRCAALAAVLLSAVFVFWARMSPQKRNENDVAALPSLTSAIKQYIMLSMKTKQDIPDALYRRFKMKTTQNGETVRNATLAFISDLVLSD